MEGQRNWNIRKYKRQTVLRKRANNVKEMRWQIRFYHFILNSSLHVQLQNENLNSVSFLILGNFFHETTKKGNKIRYDQFYGVMVSYRKGYTFWMFHCCAWSHLLSTYAKFSKKLTFLTPWYAHVHFAYVLNGPF